MEVVDIDQNFSAMLWVAFQLIIQQIIIEMLFYRKKMIMGYIHKTSEKLKYLGHKNNYKRHNYSVFVVANLKINAYPIAPSLRYLHTYRKIDELLP